MSGLPPDLRAAIADYAEGMDTREQTRRAAALSETYRAGGTSGAIASEADVAAYLTARMPATYAAVAAALKQARARAPGFEPRSLLDAGAGPGTASWAALGAWPGIGEVTMFDRNPRLIAAARRLAEASGHETLRHAHILTGDLAAPRLQSEYDLVIAAYALTELPANGVAEAVSALWRCCRGVLVVVEPGTPSGFARMLQCRERLLTEQARIAAPCPGDYRCPIVAPDWCHFAVRLPRSRDHMRAKSATVPFEDEKFSYFAAARETVAFAPARPRVLTEPHASKPGLRLKLCADGALRDETVPKRDRTAYKAVAKKKWGDVL